jgi:ABC-type amino acid transport substrate-binding protein
MLFLAALASAPGPAIEAAELPARIEERGTLRVLVTRVTGRNEFFSLESEGPPGFDRELLEGFCRVHDLRLEPVPVEGWDELVPALLAGRGDLVAGRFTVTPARSRQIAFTAQVFPTRPIAVTRRPHAGVATPEALRGVRVGTVAGSSLEEAIRKAGVPESRIDSGVGPGRLAEALREGRVEAVVLGIEDAIVARREDPELELGAFVGPPGSLAWGVRKDDSELLALLDAHIENTRRSIGWNRLVVSYFGEDAVEILRKAGTR